MTYIVLVVAAFVVGALVESAIAKKHMRRIEAENEELKRQSGEAHIGR